MDNRNSHVPYARLRVALDAKDLGFVRRHAAEIEPIALTDALEICVLIGEQEPDRLERAAARWIGRFALESKAVRIADIKAAICAFEMLPTEHDHAVASLHALCERHGMGQ